MLLISDIHLLNIHIYILPTPTSSFWLSFLSRRDGTERQIDSCLSVHGIYFKNAGSESYGYVLSTSPLPTLTCTHVQPQAKFKTT